MKILLMYKVGIEIRINIQDVSHTLDMAIYVVNELKNDSYC